MSVLDKYNKHLEDVSRQSFYLLGYLDECLSMYDKGDVEVEFVIESLRIQLEKLKKVCDEY